MDMDTLAQKFENMQGQIVEGVSYSHFLTDFQSYKDTLEKAQNVSNSVVVIRGPYTVLFSRDGFESDMYPLRTKIQEQNTFKFSNPEVKSISIIHYEDLHLLIHVEMEKYDTFVRGHLVWGEPHCVGYYTSLFIRGIGNRGFELYEHAVPSRAYTLDQLINFGEYKVGSKLQRAEEISIPLWRGKSKSPMAELHEVIPKEFFYVSTHRSDSGGFSTTITVPKLNVFSQGEAQNKRNSRQIAASRLLKKVREVKFEDVLKCA